MDLKPNSKTTNKISTIEEAATIFSSLNPSLAKMKLSLFIFSAAYLQAISASTGGTQTSAVKEVLVETNEIVSEASVVYPQNLTFPAPKTHSGVGTDLGEPQQLDATYSAEIYKAIEEAREYRNEIQQDEKLASIHHLCKNNHASCAFWAVIGECDNNPAVSYIGK